MTQSFDLASVVILVFVATVFVAGLTVVFKFMKRK